MEERKAEDYNKCYVHKAERGTVYSVGSPPKSLCEHILPCLNWCAVNVQHTNGVERQRKPCVVFMPVLSAPQYPTTCLLMLPVEPTYNETGICY